MNTQTVSLIKSGFETVTQREAEVLYLLLLGHNTKGVADFLGITVATVKQHLKNVYKKMGVHNRVEALQKTKVLLRALFSNQN